MTIIKIDRSTTTEYKYSSTKVTRFKAYRIHFPWFKISIVWKTITLPIKTGEMPVEAFDEFMKTQTDNYTTL